MTAPVLTGLHHLTFPVRDLAAGLDWYRTAFGAVHRERFDHHDATGARFAVIIDLPGLGTMVELRATTDPVRPDPDLVPATFAVADRASLARWVEHLTGLGVPCSPVTTRRIGDSVDVTAPDGRVLRLYTQPAGDLDSVAFRE